MAPTSRSGAPARAPAFGIVLHAPRAGFALFLSTPFAIRVVTWRRRSTSKPYRLRGRTWRVGPLRWTRLRESLPGPRT